MNEEKKEQIKRMLCATLNQYWDKYIINKTYLGKTIVDCQSKKLSIENIDNLIDALCCSFSKQEDLPTIKGKGRCCIKSPCGEGSISRNFTFSINNTKYERIIEGEEIRIIINDILLTFE